MNNDNVRRPLRGSMMLLLLPLVMLMAACSPAHMTRKDDSFNIKTVKPNPGKAALVVARTTHMGKGCFVKNDIEPGLQYLIARTESLETGKIQFEPDKVYYVQESPRIGWMVARVTLSPVTLEHLVEEIGEDGCTYYEIDSKDPAEDLTEHEYTEAVTDYEREIGEGYHKEFAEYKGSVAK